MKSNHTVQGLDALYKTKETDLIPPEERQGAECFSGCIDDLSPGRREYIRYLMNHESQFEQIRRSWKEAVQKLFLICEKASEAHLSLPDGEVNALASRLGFSPELFSRFAAAADDPIWELDNITSEDIFPIRDRMLRKYNLLPVL
jgi:hypothetical protein